ncbi:metal ABC transporter permease [Weissella tructae]|uniref:Zinc/manganese transport system permease protein n=2 Tax=Weissella TaxID=46255 RepID=A0A075TX18_9LACO|nr:MULTISPECIES: metal ABC transporter permease [Weissella]AIG66119.1 Zinc/manganese transport system permease protein [Weissella tructae]AIM63499.1 Zinc/manganese transport system permease protein [Weissella ceti]AIM64834.1 Zinc/manganese transport system permease protein [Weissella ceti]ELA07492.1 zinc/iron ABC transporter permease [Weissella ceti NC36]
MFSYPFMQNAFLVGTLIAVVSGFVGVFVVARHLSFLAHTLSEIGFAGAAFGLFMGWSPLWGMLIFTILAATTIGELGMQEKRSESLISAVSAVAIGLGIAFLALSQKNASAATSILFGSIFSISEQNIIQVVLLAGGVLIVGLVLFRQLRHFAFDYQTARFSLKNIVAIEVIFLVLMATTVAVSSQIVGSLLIFILMTLPASSAMRIGRTVTQMLIYAILFALIGVWSALVLSFWTNLPVSFFIAIIEAAIYFVTLAFAQKQIK